MAIEYNCELGELIAQLATLVGMPQLDRTALAQFVVELAKFHQAVHQEPTVRLVELDSSCVA
jgi:hypothetical protein